MPKILREPPPTSSVVRLLDTGAAARAVAPPGAIVPAVHEAMGHARETTTRKREFVLTALAEETLSNLVETYRKATGTRLSASHVVRALLMAVKHAMPHLEAHGKTVGGMKLPSNARGQEFHRERFEERIACAIVEGMRRASAMDRKD